VNVKAGKKTARYMVARFSARLENLRVMANDASNDAVMLLRVGGGHAGKV